MPTGFDVKLYFSGTPGGAQNIVDSYLLDNDAFRLSTFAYPKEATHYLNVATEKNKRARMIIDSGAFTAWTVDKPVDINDLIEYNENLIKVYGNKHDFIFISLDVIPGEKGRSATSEEIAAAVDQSYANFVQLQKHFHPHTVLPVYHSGESVSLRNAYLDLTDYICLSMDQGMHESVRLEWAKRAIVPGFKFHGLAATGNRMVTEVDWYSVDSSSWLTVGGMGGILWPSNGRVRVLPISNESPSRHTAGAHYNTLTPAERAAVDKAIIDRGFTPEQLIEKYEQRHLWNVGVWLNTPWRKNAQPAMDLFS